MPTPNIEASFTFRDTNDVNNTTSIHTEKVEDNCDHFSYTSAHAFWESPSKTEITDCSHSHIFPTDHAASPSDHHSSDSHSHSSDSHSSDSHDSGH